MIELATLLNTGLSEQQLALLLNLVNQGLNPLALAVSTLHYTTSHHPTHHHDPYQNLIILLQSTH